MAGGYHGWAPSVPYGTELTQLTTNYQPDFLLYSKKHYTYPVLTVKSSTDQFTEYTPYDDKVCITDNEEKRQRLKALHNNASYGKPNDKLSRKFPDVPVVTYHGIQALKKCPFYHPTDCFFLITTKAFLPIRMPYFFNYTTIVMRNNVRQGLLHTLLRHPQEWSNKIYDLGILLKARDHLNRHIWGVTNKRYKNYLLKSFENAMQNFTYAEFLRLNKMQMYIYEYFKLNMVQANYMGEGCSDDGTMNVLFRVSDDCMLVGLSNVVIGANRRTGDHRRIRLITTAFFNEFLNPLTTLQQPTS